VVIQEREVGADEGVGGEVEEAHEATELGVAGEISVFGTELACLTEYKTQFACLSKYRTQPANCFISWDYLYFLSFLYFPSHFLFPSHSNFQLCPCPLSLDHL
jgi:hypothetical protein